MNHEKQNRTEKIKALTAEIAEKTLSLPACAKAGGGQAGPQRKTFASFA